MKNFWQFAYERQAIWHRRFIERRQKPYTDDPVLQRYHFTNVHRELDAGTQVVHQLVVNQEHMNMSPVSLIFNAMLYRIFNRADMWQTCDPYVCHYDELDQSFKKIREYRDAGYRIAPAAWTVPPLVHINGNTWLDRVETAVKSWDIITIAKNVQRATTLVEANDALIGAAGIGPFIRLQVILDLTAVFNFTDDETLPSLYSSKGKHRNNKDYLKPQGSAEGERLVGCTIKELRDHQDLMLTDEGLTWSEIAWQRKPRLTMADLEHTLCEWTKYITVHDASNKKWMRRYDGS